ncbi:hypothetical protein AB0I28_37770 [Phytomonospora sp. NPDC050363]|uniref:hypothetical protein n=1 Tax=Phytomonospora sp. NPDC050363 TaxID=3155642 RepID=UPI0033EBD4F1
MTATAFAHVSAQSGTDLTDLYAPDFQRQVRNGDWTFDLTATTLEEGRRYALEVAALGEDGEPVAHLTAVVAATALAHTRWMFGRLIDEVRCARKRMGVEDPSESGRPS